MDRLLRSAQGYLHDRGIPGARLDAELLLCDALSCRRIDLYLRHDMPVSDGQRDRFRALAKRRAGGEPVAYILGRREFHGLDFRVDARCLIPRPETEHLVDEALEFLRDRASATPRVLDVGCGSGCIAISLASEMPEAVIHGVDLSEGALKVSRENAQRLVPGANVRLLQGDLCAPLQGGDPLDLIVSNPPYIASGEMAALDVDVRGFEPEMALCSGADPLLFHRRLIDEGLPLLVEDGALMMELAGTGAGVDELVSRAGRISSWKLIRDLAGLERVLVLRR